MDELEIQQGEKAPLLSEKVHAEPKVDADPKVVADPMVDADPEAARLNKALNDMGGGKEDGYGWKMVYVARVAIVFGFGWLWICILLIGGGERGTPTPYDYLEKAYRLYNGDVTKFTTPLVGIIDRPPVPPQPQDLDVKILVGGIFSNSCGSKLYYSWDNSFLFEFNNWANPGTSLMTSEQIWILSEPFQNCSDTRLTVMLCILADEKIRTKTHCDSNHQMSLCPCLNATLQVNVHELYSFAYSLYIEEAVVSPLDHRDADSNRGYDRDFILYYQNFLESTAFPGQDIRFMHLSLMVQNPVEIDRRDNPWFRIILTTIVIMFAVNETLKKIFSVLPILANFVCGGRQLIHADFWKNPPSTCLLITDEVMVALIVSILLIMPILCAMEVFGNVNYKMIILWEFAVLLACVLRYIALFCYNKINSNPTCTLCPYIDHFVIFTAQLFLWSAPLIGSLAYSLFSVAKNSMQYAEAGEKSTEVAVGVVLVFTIPELLFQYVMLLWRLSSKTFYNVF